MKVHQLLQLLIFGLFTLLPTMAVVLLLLLDSVLLLPLVGAESFALEQSVFVNDKRRRNLVVLDAFVWVNDNVVILEPVLNTVIHSSVHLL